MMCLSIHYMVALDSNGEEKKPGECLLLIGYTFTSESGLYTHSPLSSNQNTLFKIHHVLIGRLL